MINFWSATKRIYQEMYRQATLRGNYEFHPDKNESKVLMKFMRWFKKEHTVVTVGTLIQYFEFQFSRYEGIKIPRYGKNSIVFYWVAGDKARRLWKQRDLNMKWLVKVKLRDEVKMDLTKAFKEEHVIRKNQQTTKLFTEIYDYEEDEKQRFYNTVKGFVYCTTATTLFNSNSKWCSACNNQERCINFLSENFPKIFDIRWQSQNSDS